MTDQEPTTNPGDFVFSCLMVRLRVVEKVYLLPNGAATFRGVWLYLLIAYALHGKAKRLCYDSLASGRVLTLSAIVSNGTVMGHIGHRAEFPGKWDRVEQLGQICQIDDLSEPLT